ncbi:uncharacterized protein LOC117650540 [Thrips palmi]|uniref:Uncharacterized protein LOC117650540 n=1 Tax=Thrips palmi TaxID=161013 RepID=A0A6P8ZXW4_THRPL|nr:uncharacterized protein LOC117650540 [Thrips palmi]
MGKPSQRLRPDQTDHPRTALLARGSAAMFAAVVGNSVSMSAYSDWPPVWGGHNVSTFASLFSPLTSIALVAAIQSRRPVSLPEPLLNGGHTYAAVHLDTIHAVLLLI